MDGLTGNVTSKFAFRPAGPGKISWDTGYVIRRNRFSFFDGKGDGTTNKRGKADGPDGPLSVGRAIGH